MVRGDVEDLGAYARKLRGYSAQELEDIYFNIHVLRQPMRYHLVLRELEARRLAVAPEHPPRSLPNLRGWITTRPGLRKHPVLRACLLSWALFMVTMGVTLAMLAPIWLFAVPLHFIGLQPALVYFSCAPVPPIMGAAVGGRLGGRGAYALPVLLGVAAALAVFGSTGAPDAIVRALIEPQGSGSGGFGF